MNGICLLYRVIVAALQAHYWEVKSNIAGIFSVSLIGMGLDSLSRCCNMT